jgi:hypothetical protein
MAHPAAKCLQNYVYEINDHLLHDVAVRYTPDVADLVVENFTLYGRMLVMTQLTKTTPPIWNTYANKVRRYWFELS